MQANATLGWKTWSFTKLLAELACLLFYPVSAYVCVRERGRGLQCVLRQRSRQPTALILANKSYRLQNNLGAKSPAAGTGWTNWPAAAMPQTFHGRNHFRRQTVPLHEKNKNKTTINMFCALRRRQKRIFQKTLVNLCGSVHRTAPAPRCSGLVN